MDLPSPAPEPARAIGTPRGPEARRSGAGPPRRPLFATALALAAGGWLAFTLSPTLGSLLTAALAVAPLAVLRPRRSSRAQPAGEPGVEHGVEYRSTSRRRAASTGVCCAARRVPTWLRLLFALAVLRGLALSPVAEVSPAAPALQVAGRAESRGATWRALGGDWGWLGSALLPAPGTPRLEVAGGSPRPGERVRLAFPGPPLPRARGPEPAARGPARNFAGVVELRADQVRRLTPSGSRWVRAARGELARARAFLARRADELDGPRNRGLARALLTGDTSRLDPELRDLFTRTGTRHLLAVSGLHVGLVLALFALPLGRRASRALGPRAGALFVACALVLYAPLAGGAAPVERAALAALLAALAPVMPSGAVRARRSATLHGNHRVPPIATARAGAAERRPRPLGRTPDARTLWGLALVLECLADPAAPLRTGVRLSYLGTLGLIVLYRPLRQSLGALGATVAPGSGRGLPGRSPGPLARALGALGSRAALGGLSASLAASLAVLPEVWARFGEWAPASLVVTPLALPPLALFLLAAWPAALLPGWELPAAVVRLAGGALTDLLELADALPGTPWLLPARPAWLLTGTALLLARALLVGARWKRPAWLAAGLVLLPWAPAPAALEVHALDVGHGTAVVVRAPGLPLLVFDAGSRDRYGLGREALMPLLARWETDRPLVVLSHSDRDHSGALPWLIERARPVLWAGALAPELAARLPADMRRVDPGVGRTELRTGRGPRLTLLRGALAHGNEGSRALLVESDGARLLLTGDAEAEGLAGILAAGDWRAPLDLLLLPHHGSDSALVGALLEATRPARVWVSASAPPALGQELTRRGLRWSSTEREGPLTWPPPARGDSAEALAESPGEAAQAIATASEAPCEPP